MPNGLTYHGCALLAARVGLIALGLSVSFAARSAEIYRWVDADGKTQLSDTVPPQYRSSAVRLDTRESELSPEQQRDALARAARTRDILAEPVPRRAGSGRAPVNALPQTAGNASASTTPQDASECETLQRQYRESQECFAPYVNANGSLKPRALTACKAVDDPTVKCGSPKAY